MPQAQWVIFTIENRSDYSDDVLIIKNLELSHGIIHQNGHPDREIGVWSVEGTEIPQKEQFTFSSCGGFWAGTKGSFDIYIKEGNAKLCHCYWDCPRWWSSNAWAINDRAAQWIIQDVGESPTGPLGHITISAWDKRISALE